MESYEPRLYPNFEHEYDVRQWVRSRLHGRGGVFIDVGANVGIWTIDLASLFDRVYAVEPWFAEQLRMNLVDYGVGNAVVVEAAAWDFNGQVIIGIRRLDNIVAGKILPAPRVGLPGRTVKAVRLDDIIGEPFRLLKIDVEGEAVHVLRGMTRLLDTSSGIAVVEVHNHGESHGVYCFMMEHGWKLETTLREWSVGEEYHGHKVFVK